MIGQGLRTAFARVLWGETDTRRMHAPPPLLARALPLITFACFPLALIAVLGATAAEAGSLGIDFRQAFWPAGRAVLHGHTPYPPVDPGVLAHGAAFVYPPFVAITLAPVALLPAALATAIAIVVTVAALGGSLWVLGVREWRCYGAALISPPVLGCVQTAALSGLIALGIALAWRYRSRGPVSLLLVAIVIAAKLFLWPLILWVLVVRGVRAGLATGAGACALAVAPWLAGFPGFTQYPDLLRVLTDVEGAGAYTPRALALSMGATSRAAEVAAIVVGGAILVLAALAARRRDADRRVLALTILAALFFSPVVWAHYLVILLPVVAIARPRMGWAWLALALFWATGGAEGTSNGLLITLGLLTMIVVTAVGFLPRRAEPTAERNPWPGVASLAAR